MTESESNGLTPVAEEIEYEVYVDLPGDDGEMQECVVGVYKNRADAAEHRDALLRAGRPAWIERWS
jgi:hypothetical protein